MDLMDFYTKSIETLGYVVDGDVAMTEVSGMFIPVKISSRTVVVPTKEHLKSMYRIDDDGSRHLDKVAYNPLREGGMRGEDIVGRMIKKRFGVSIISRFVTITELLLTNLIEDIENPKPTIINLLSDLGDIKVNKNSRVIDDKSSKIILGVLTEAMSSKQPEDVVAKLVMAKKKDTGRYSGVASMLFPLYQLLLKNIGTKFKYKGIEMRVKDIGVLITLFRHIFPDIDSGYSVGSSDEFSPDFVSQNLLYSKIAKHINVIVNDIPDISDDIVDTLLLKYLDESEIKKAPTKYKSEYRLIIDADLTNEKSSAKRTREDDRQDDIETNRNNNSLKRSSYRGRDDDRRDVRDRGGRGRDYRDDRDYRGGRRRGGRDDRDYRDDRGRGGRDDRDYRDDNRGRGSLKRSSSRGRGGRDDRDYRRDDRDYRGSRRDYRDDRNSVKISKF